MKVALLPLLVTLTACTGVEPRIAPGKPCDIDAEAGVTPPAWLPEVRTGMSMHEIVRIIGTPAYSPTAGQYYFDGESAEGECVIATSGDLTKACTLVVEFRARIEGQRDTRLTDRITGCWWGGIGE